MRQTGVDVVTIEDDSITVTAASGLKGVDVMTEPYPGFPTDMQAQWMALMTTSRRGGDGDGNDFREPVYARPGARAFRCRRERPRSVGDRTRQGKLIRCAGHGDRPAGVGLLWCLTGLAAKGETIVNRVYHLDRGYERLGRKAWRHAGPG